MFIFPGALHTLRAGDLARLPYIKANEEKHVFFHCADHEDTYGRKCMFIRCNLRPWNLKPDPNSIAWPWGVENFSECVELPGGGFKYDVSFQGWLHSEVRKVSVQSCANTSTLTCDIAGYSDFCGYIYYTPEGIRRRAEFRRSMRESRVALCPESIPGVFPYRFYEAMSAGRVPVLVGSDFVFPFADEIPYQDFALQIPRQDAAKAGDIIQAYLKETSDDELKRRGLLARGYWKSLLNRDDWPRTMTYAVRKKLGA